MKKPIPTKTLSVLSACALSLGMFGGIPMSQALAAPASSGPAIVDFTTPGQAAKPMARMWFPDASAGADSQDLIAKQVNALAAEGFGGVEVTMLADGTSYTGTDSATIGWGTDDWISVMKKMLIAADAVPGGFEVDFTITAHWPPLVNTIDPNDAAASQQLSYSFTKLTAADLAATTPLSLALPTPQTTVSGGGFGAPATVAPFLFTDTLVSATLAQVTAIDPTTGAFTLKFDSLQPISGSAVTRTAAYPAGIPDAAMLASAPASYGWTSAVQANTATFFGPAAACDATDPCNFTNGVNVGNNSGKQDAAGNRRLAADTQYTYAADLSGLTGLSQLTLNDDPTVGVGDYVVVSTFDRGTGQTIGAGKIMSNGAFITNYFNQAGTQILTSYWDSMFARDPQLKSLMQNAKVKGNIFEDSIEVSGSESYWTTSAWTDLDHNGWLSGYQYAGILSLVAACQYQGGGFGPPTTLHAYSFDNPTLASRIYEDYQNQFANMYINDRVVGLATWANSTIGWGFRGQTYPIPGMEIAAAQALNDVIEGDNSGKEDALRYMAGTVNMTGKSMLSIEAMTGITSMLATMGDLDTEAGQNFSDGVNRLLLHGTPYAKTFNEYNSDWPGWIPFGAGSFGEQYTYRQPYWDEMTTDMGYFARTSAVLQDGTAKIDVGVLQDQIASHSLTSGSKFTGLLDHGFAYNLLSETTLTGANATVTGGVLNANGPAYKAIVVDSATVESVATVNALIADATAGLPIVLCGSDVTRVLGTDTTTNNDALVQARWATLAAMSNVKSVAGPDDVLAALTALGVTPYASYSQTNLESTMYTDPVDGTNYYYMFNNSFAGNTGMMGNAQGKNYKGSSLNIVNATVTLTGTGVPYELDARTGAITQVGQYTVNANGTVTFTIPQLNGGDSIIYALTTNTADFPTVGDHVTAVQPATGASIVRTDEGLALRSATAGTYTVTTSASDTMSVTVPTTVGAIDLSNQAWDLTIHSWGPKYPTNVIATSGQAAWSSIDPSESIVTTVDLGQHPLGNWEDIVLTTDQQAALGVPSMDYVSGVADYSTTFTTPSGWTSDTGAYLDVTYGWDQVGSVTVNGTVFTPDNASDRIDIGSALVQGSNDIVIELSSTLYARAVYENSGYANQKGHLPLTISGMFGGGGAQPYWNGLNTATLTPYTQLMLVVPEPAVTVAAPTVTSPAANATTTAKPTVTGVADPGVSVTVKDETGAVLCTTTANATSGAFTCTSQVALSDGPHTLSVVASDPNGNMSTPTTVAITVQASQIQPPPPLGPGGGTGGSTTGGTPKTGGTAMETTQPVGYAGLVAMLIMVGAAGVLMRVRTRRTR
ncbi:MAG: Ig-like domain-containing protein [Propionibacteriaceae bacterium]|nr:Ig-like domain-containing protein [Propionibacteriaceae bacterium]